MDKDETVEHAHAHSLAAELLHSVLWWYFSPLVRTIPPSGGPLLPDLLTSVLMTGIKHVGFIQCFVEHQYAHDHTRMMGHLDCLEVLELWP